MSLDCRLKGAVIKYIDKNMFHRNFHLRRIVIGFTPQSHKRIIVTNRRQFVGFSSKLKAFCKPLVVSITHSRPTLVSSIEKRRARKRKQRQGMKTFPVFIIALKKKKKTFTGCHTQRTHRQCGKCRSRS